MPRRGVAQQVFRRAPRRPVVGGTTVQRNPAYRAATTYSGTVTNSGTIATAPTISYTATGSVASVYFENATAGKTVWISQPLVTNDVLSVDFAARTVTLNSVTVTGVATVDSRWWDLAPGANTVRSNVAATVNHRNAYA